jgi:hypothetical protein
MRRTTARLLMIGALLLVLGLATTDTPVFAGASSGVPTVPVGQCRWYTLGDGLGGTVPNQYLVAQGVQTGPIAPTKLSITYQQPNNCASSGTVDLIFP